MKFDQKKPPEGTIRDWLDYRAKCGGVAMVFPESGDTLRWDILHTKANSIAKTLTNKC